MESGVSVGGVWRRAGGRVVTSDHAMYGSPLHSTPAYGCGSKPLTLSPLTQCIF